MTAWLTDFRDDLPRIDVPVMVIQGDADRILPIDATGRRLARILDRSRFVEVKDAPHGLLWTHADEFNRELLGFLEQRIPREVTRTATPV